MGFARAYESRSYEDALNIPLLSLDPNARLVTIGEYDAGIFQGTLDRFHGARLQCFAGFETCDRTGCDMRQLCKTAHGQP